MRRRKGRARRRGEEEEKEKQQQPLLPLSPKKGQDPRSQHMIPPPKVPNPIWESDCMFTGGQCWGDACL